jgi:16S rRNA (guanine527-N7)-methyltransferase
LGSPDTATRLAELVTRFGLPPEAGTRLAALLAILAGDPQAPSTVTDPSEALDVHVSDSLAALEFDEVRRATTIADLGSGAGFPGLPLAIALPHARVALVESARRRCDFLGRTVAALDLGNVEVVCARAEAPGLERESHDLVTARALADLPVVAEYAAPLLRLGGLLVVWRGARDVAAERDAEAAAEILGLRPEPPIPVRPYPASRRRHLHPFRKVGPTPPRFPRRPGMARKRPLRASSEDLTWRG